MITGSLSPRSAFLRRVANHVLAASALIVTALTLGTFGYRFVAKFDWIDAFLNAAMILTGMGPVGALNGTPAKLFASFYALFSGIVFLTGASVAVAPLFHRLLHRFHLEDVARAKEGPPGTEE